MVDSKYGRLFTEEDVRGMLVQAACWAMDDLNATVTAGDIADRTIESYRVRLPPDEPLFLLRGQDLAAHGGAWAYAYEASRVGASIEFVTSALGAANDLRDWAEQHRDRMKVPD